jgi:hypothetical protein
MRRIPQVPALHLSPGCVFTLVSKESDLYKIKNTQHLLWIYRIRWFLECNGFVLWRDIYKSSFNLKKR